MLNTKLIFVDGITGSGKSTTAHFIARQLKMNGIKVKWFYEQDNEHPFPFKFEGDDKTKYQEDFFNKYPEQLAQVADMMEKDDVVYIVESWLFQDILAVPLWYDYDRDKLSEFYQKYCSAFKKLNPVVIHLYQNDVEKAMQANWQRRGDGWKNSIIARDEKSPYYKNRNLLGETGFIKFFQEMTDISKELFNGFEFKKIQIENSAHDWERYRKQIVGFLEIPMLEEKLFDKSFEKHCGKYLGGYTIFDVHIHNNRLCVDEFWPNLKLLPVLNDEFELEGFPISFKFSEDGNSFQITKASCYYKEGDICEKIELPALNQTELEYFCGDYWCESEKLTRKIYIKNESLYYWREENNETLLIPVKKNSLLMKGVGGMINFDSSIKQYILSGSRQDDMLFVEQNQR